MFKKILIANRGEIALRIIRTCKEMGIKSVVVYSTADSESLPVRFADEAVCIGPQPSSQSYLVQEKTIEVALERNVDGIHPGYGFLSENAEFAQKVTKAGIIFIGPSPESMCVMGDKLAAKSAVKGYDIPMVPGVDHAIENVESALKTAKEIGFGKVMQPLRLSLVGAMKGPDVFDIMVLLGKKESINRIQAILK